jgi:proteic killer suppression protein
VIKSFADKRTAAIFYGHIVRSLPPAIQKRARIKLEMIDAARQIADLRSPPGNRLEELSGNRAGHHAFALTTNGAFASCGVTARSLTLKLSTIIEEQASIRREDIEGPR